MGRHSADAGSGSPGDETGPLNALRADDSGSQETVPPPLTPGHRKRIAIAIGITLVGLILLVFGFITLTTTQDPTSTTSQNTSATPTVSAVTTSLATLGTTSVATSAVPVVMPVTVLNASRDLTAGLATRVASALEAGGWPIADVSNYSGPPLDQTTAFFTPGSAAEEAGAQALVAQFPEITGGAQPRFDGLTGTGLTVAAAGDWLP